MWMQCVGLSVLGGQVQCIHSHKYMYALTTTFLRTYLPEVKGLAHTVVCQTSFFVAKAGSKPSYLSIVQSFSSDGYTHTLHYHNAMEDN